MRGLNLKEIMFKSNMNQQGLNIATYRQAYVTLLFLMALGFAPCGTYKNVPIIGAQNAILWDSLVFLYPATIN